jgi:hypothetical protein
MRGSSGAGSGAGLIPPPPPPPPPPPQQQQQQQRARHPPKYHRRPLGLALWPDCALPARAPRPSISGGPTPRRRRARPAQLSLTPRAAPPLQTASPPDGPTGAWQRRSSSTPPSASTFSTGATLNRGEGTTRPPRPPHGHLVDPTPPPRPPPARHHCGQPVAAVHEGGGAPRPPRRSLPVWPHGTWSVTAASASACLGGASVAREQLRPCQRVSYTRDSPCSLAAAPHTAAVRAVEGLGRQRRHATDRRDRRARRPARRARERQPPAALDASSQRSTESYSVRSSATDREGHDPARATTRLRSRPSWRGRRASRRCRCRCRVGVA